MQSKTMPPRLAKPGDVGFSRRATRGWAKSRAVNTTKVRV